jgi:hypothetical protein
MGIVSQDRNFLEKIFRLDAIFDNKVEIIDAI